MKLLKITLVVLLTAIFFSLTSCECKHEWVDATCTEPRHCSKCGITEGEPLKHDWAKATVNSPKKCKLCGLTEGDALIAIPDIANTDETTAKNICSAKGIIPKIEYKYDDYVDEGNVISTDPMIGNGVASGDPVTIYISQGPEYLDSIHSTITWYHIGVNPDEWDLYNSYIDHGTLYISCSATFAETIHWKKWSGGAGFGEASITDTFDKVVPIVINAEEYCYAGEAANITLEVPLGDLNVSKPTTMSMKLIAQNEAGEQVTIRVSFTMTW